MLWRGCSISCNTCIHIIKLTQTQTRMTKLFTKESKHPTSFGSSSYWTIDEWFFIPLSIISSLCRIFFTLGLGLQPLARRKPTIFVLNMLKENWSTEHIKKEIDSFWYENIYTLSPSSMTLPTTWNLRSPQYFE